MRRIATRRQFLQGLATLPLLAGSSGLSSARQGVAGIATAAKGQRPNILLVMVDDMGFSDVGCYGGEIETPNLDALANGGVRFSQFYNCARCCPTRASLLTGMYPHRAGIGYMEPHNRYNRPIVQKLGIPEYQGALRQDCVTLPEALRAAGYHTWMTGKWHVGARDGERPWERGFARSFGILGGAGNHFRPGTALWEDGQPVAAPDDYYSTDAFSAYAARCIRETPAGQPFFDYVAYTAPHWPIQAHAQDIARYRGRYRDGWDVIRRNRLRKLKQQGILPAATRLSPRHPESYPWQEADQPDMELRMAVYAAMIHRMDHGVGELRQALRDAGRERNTLVLFLSDNGGCAEPYGRNAAHPIPPGPAESDTGVFLPWANASNTPFRLFKHWMHEGGIATPLIASWPEHIPAGAVQRNQTGHVKDIMATCLDAAGVVPPQARQGRPAQPGDGRSLLPSMRDPGFAANETLFWEHEGNRAVREGNWKLVSVYNQIHEQMNRVGAGRRTGQWELYHLATDRTELLDLADAHPDRVRAMVAQYEAWAAELGVRDWESLLRLGGYHQLD
ncbi:MAG: arylsulfatase [Bryobacterales bacterium]|nr:arylsulfatase [Bryobacterales bacterium]